MANDLMDLDATAEESGAQVSAPPEAQVQQPETVDFDATARAAGATVSSPVKAQPPKVDWDAEAQKAGAMLSSGQPAQIDWDKEAASAGATISAGIPKEWIREDGSTKGLGFLGLMKRKDGGVSSEISVGVEINGKEMDVPTMVPTLSKDEVNWLLTHDVSDPSKMPKGIIQKAADYARERLKAGKPVFAGMGEQQNLYPDIPRAETPDFLQPPQQPSKPAPPPNVPTAMLTKIVAPPQVQAPTQPGSLETVQEPTTRGVMELVEAAKEIKKAAPPLKVIAARVALGQPPLDMTPETMQGMSDALEGLMKSATPLAPTAAVAAPFKSALAYFATDKAGTLGDKLAAYANGTPEERRFASLFMQAATMGILGSKIAQDALAATGEAAGATVRPLVLAGQLLGEKFPAEVAPSVRPAPSSVTQVVEEAGRPSNPEPPVGDTIAQAIRTAAAPEGPQLNLSPDQITSVVQRASTEQLAELSKRATPEFKAAAQEELTRRYKENRQPPIARPPATVIPPSTTAAPQREVPEQPPARAAGFPERTAENVQAEAEARPEIRTDENGKVTSVDVHVDAVKKAIEAQRQANIDTLVHPDTTPAQAETAYKSLISSGLSDDQIMARIHDAADKFEPRAEEPEHEAVPPTPEMVTPGEEAAFNERRKQDVGPPAGTEERRLTAKEQIRQDYAANPAKAKADAEEMERKGEEARANAQAERTYHDANRPVPPLPKELAGAKPRYNIGPTSYTPVFESDLDKALFILAQTNPSARDADYLKYVQNTLGIKEWTARELAKGVKSYVGSLAKQQPAGGELHIPQHVSMGRGVKAAEETTEKIPAAVPWEQVPENQRGVWAWNRIVGQRMDASGLTDEQLAAAWKHAKETLADTRLGPANHLTAESVMNAVTRELSRRQPKEPENGPDVTINKARQSIEVKFKAKPEQAVLDKLKARGYKWAKTNQLWYRRVSGKLEDEQAAVRAMLGPVKQATTVTPTPAAEKPKAPVTPQVPAPKGSTPLGAKQWTSIGYNEAGQELFEDANGVRSYVENGVRQTEPVSLRPTREGMVASPSTPRRKEYEVHSKTPAQVKMPKGTGSMRHYKVGEKVLFKDHDGEWKETEVISPTREDGSTGILHPTLMMQPMWPPGAKPSRARTSADQDELRPIVPGEKEAALQTTKVPAEPATEVNPTAQDFFDEMQALDDLIDTGQLDGNAKSTVDRAQAIWDRAREAGVDDELAAMVRAAFEKGGGKLSDIFTTEPEGRKVEADEEASGRTGTRQLPESGRGAAEPAGTAGEGALGEVSPESGEGTEGQGARQPGPRRTPGGVANPVSRSPRASSGSESEHPAGGSDVQESVDVPPSGDIHDPGHAAPDYTLTAARIQAIIGRGPVQRAADNLAAIKLVKKLAEEKRYATREEQEVLAKYVGFGATDMANRLSKYPDRTWSANEREIWQGFQDVLTPEERTALADSSPFAHFTYDLFGPMWAAIARAGFEGGRVLEPSVGTGHAFGLMPPQMRANSTLNGVELEPYTAAIAHHLYPSARIQPVGFEHARLARGTQDVIIGNPPFSEHGVRDLKMPDIATEALHNYFFAKALEYLRPGGILMFVATHYAMDSSKAVMLRRYLMEHADFVGAVRLPGGQKGAFSKTAKTEVVTDIVILRKLADGEKATNADLFVNAPPNKELSKPDYRGNVQNVYRSSWYDEHPEYILGEEGLTGTMRGRNEYGVEATEGDLQKKILDALSAIMPEGSFKPVEETRPEQKPRPEKKVVTGPYKPGQLRVGEDKKSIVKVDMHGETSDATPRKRDGSVDTAAVKKVIAMIGIRDARNALIELMQDPASTDDQIKAGQKELNKLYDRFVNPNSEEPEYLNNRANKRLFADDPEATNLRALEKVEPRAVTTIRKKDGKRVIRLVYDVKGKQDIFTKRTVRAEARITHVDTPRDALFTSLGLHARIDWNYMSQLYGHPVKEIQAALVDEGLVYEQPDGSYELADEYLSGDVVSKLEDAEAAGKKFEKNVEALKAVQPKAKTAEDIAAGIVGISFGSHWVPPKDVESFLAEQLGVNPRNVSVKISSTHALVTWQVNYTDAGLGAAGRHQWVVKYDFRNPEDVNSAKRTYDFADLVNDTLNLRRPDLSHRERISSKETILVKEPTAELAAAANQELLRAAWEQWVLSHPDAMNRMLEIFNTRFNRTVERKYDGSHMQYPGMAQLYNSRGEEIHFYSHQNNGIYRILASGNTLLAHEVGAGKTFEMIAAAMEMRRTGRATKPMITVPTYLIQQWAADIVKLYPKAKLLAFDEKDLAADKRQVAMARISHGDWDMVLVPHSSFELLSVSDERMVAVMREWEAELTALIGSPEDEDESTEEGVKEAARKRRWIRKKIQEKLDAIKNHEKDNALTWEQLGVDALFVDEAHAFKNLFFFSKIENLRGLSKSESDRSLDMYVKIKDINEQSNFRNVVMATATPVMNSIAEIFAYQRYLQPQTLAENGVDSFDNWYAMFAKAVPTTERQPDGTYREVMRLRDYSNLQTLSKMVREVMDYISWDDMPYLKLPGWKGGKIEIVQTEKHPLYDEIVMPWIRKRMAAVRANPPHYDRRRKLFIAPDRPDAFTGEATGRPDLVLTIMNDAKKAAIDLRLLFGDRVKDFPGSRMQTAADRMVQTWKREADKKGVILVFLDMGTPRDSALQPLDFLRDVEVEDETEGALDDEEKQDADAASDDGVPDAANLYEILKQELIKRGVPAREIAFIHQAKKPAERLTLFDAANEGKVRFVFASTDKGGVGMNIQTRLAALYELDLPRYGRPGDLRQRMGRAIRQGNLYRDWGGVEHVRFVTKDTTDEWQWGVTSYKDYQTQKFYRGEASRMLEEDPSTMSIEEAQIRATGDKRAIELTELNGRMARLEAQAAAGEMSVAAAKGTIVKETNKRETAERELAEYKAWEPNFSSKRGKNFSMKVGDTTFDDREEANKALMAEMAKLLPKGEPKRTRWGQNFNHPVKIGEIGGLDLYAQDHSSHTQYERDVEEKGKKKRESYFETRYEVKLWIDGRPLGQGSYGAGEYFKSSDKDFGVGQDAAVQTVNAYEKIPNIEPQLKKEIETSEAALEQAERVVKNPPRAVADLVTARARVKELEAELMAESKAREAAEAAAHKAEVEAKKAQAGGSNAMMAIPWENEPSDTRLKSKTFTDAQGNQWRLEPYESSTSKNGIAWKVIKNGEEVDGAPTLEEAKEIASRQMPPQSGTHKMVAVPMAEEGEETHEMVAIPAAAAEALRAAGTALNDARQDIITTVSPATTNMTAKWSARILRARIAEMEQRRSVAERALQKYEDAFEKLAVGAKDPNNIAIRENLLNIADALEDPEGTGRQLPEELQAWGALRDELFKREKDLQDDLGLGLEWREYYLGHIWERQYTGPSLASDILRRMMGRRPLEGPKSFRRKRTIPTTREGVEEFKKEPVTWNWVTLDLTKLQEMRRFTLAHQFLADGKHLGTIIFKSALAKRPEGMVPLPDPIGEVWLPPHIDVKETFDAGLYVGLESLLTQLGVRIDRRPSTGKAWGTTKVKPKEDGTPDIEIFEKFGGPMEVRMHELGHALDALFGLSQRIIKNPNIAQELQNLAALRHEGLPHASEAFKQYAQMTPELIANLVYAYLYAPDRAREVAPEAMDEFEKFVEETPIIDEALPDLQNLRTLAMAERTDRQRLAGPILAGKYYTSPEAAKLIERYLSPGLGAHPAWRWLRWPVNLVTQYTLAGSAFHAIAIGGAAAGTELGFGLRELARRRGLAGLKAIGGALAAPVSTAIEGTRLRKTYETQFIDPVSVRDPMARAVLDSIQLIMAGGGRVASSREYNNRMIRALRHQWIRGMSAWEKNLKGTAAKEAGKMLLTAIPAALEAAAWPILDRYVPAVKAAMVVRGIRRDLEAIPGTPTPETIMAIAQKHVDHADAVFGQVIWDNRFWNRVVLNAMHMVIMAPGWRGGSLVVAARALTDLPRSFLPDQLEQYTYLPYKTGGGGNGGGGEGGEGAKEIAKNQPQKMQQQAESRFSLYMSSFIGIMALYAAMGELYQLLHGAGHIQSPKDAYDPRTGEGEERVRLPGYGTVFYEMLRRGPISMVDYAIGGWNPLWRVVADVFKNETPYGEEIYTDSDPWQKELKDITHYIVGERVQPIAVSSFGRRSGTGAEKAESLLGVSPAPRTIERTPAEEQMHEWSVRERGVRTKKQGEQYRLEREIREAQTSDSQEAQDLAAEALASGKLSKKQIQNALKAGVTKQSALQAQFKALTLDRALYIYELATPEERQQLQGLLMKKASDTLPTAPAADIPELIDRFNRAMDLSTGAEP